MTSDFGAPQQPIRLLNCRFEGGVISVEVLKNVSSGMFVFIRRRREFFGTVFTRETASVEL